MYHSAEDAWYSFLDKVDTVIPIYSVVDPIDKVVPSFAIVLALLAALLFVFVGLPLLGGGSTDVVLNFRDEQGNPIQGLSVQVSYGDFSSEPVTNSLGNIPLSNVPVGTTIFVSAQHPNYGAFSEEATVSEPNEKLSFTLSLSKAPPSELSFQFTDLGGLSLSGKPISIQLSCTTGAPLKQSTFITSDGVFSITPPADCGNLVGSVSANGYVKKDGVVFSVSNPIVQLQSLVVETGKVKVTVRDDLTNAALVGMDVELISQQGASINSIVTNSFGVSIFSNVPVGSYYASVTDPNGNYALTTGDPITVSPNQTVNAEVSLGKQVQGVVKVFVNDKATGNPVIDSIVKLVGKNDNKLYASKSITPNESSLSFELTDKGPFVVTASHANYLAQSKDIGLLNGEQSVTFAMEKLTASNSGKVSVSVKDEDNLPVDNAQVFLYDASTGFIAHAYEPKITDVNGTAHFTGVNSGNYFARATKYPAGPSDSQPFTTDKSVPAQASLTLKIGQGTVQVIVKDTEGTPVPFALVQFLTDGSDECAPGKCTVQSDALGMASKSFKADRKVYVNVTAPGFSGFSSTSHQLYSGKTELIQVKLPKTILGDSPRIVFVDVVDPITGTSAKEIKSGKAYVALFQLQIPTALQLDTAGVHIRVGDESLSENDSIRIVTTQIPNTSVIKGTSYQPDEGYDADQENLTNGESKWINAEWDSPEPGVYEFGVVVRADDDVSVLDPLTLYYRAWGIEDNDWLRDPVDNVLGESSSSAGKEGQYAEAYQKIYYSGKPIVCEEEFCYSGETILNEDDELLIDGPPYGLSVNKNFTYSFVLTSADETTFENPRLRVFFSNDGFSPSSEAVFTEYHVIGTNGQPIDADGLSTNDVPGGEGQGLSVGQMKQYQNISGEFSFLTKKVEATQILIQLIDAGDIVFEKSIDLDIYSSNTLNIEVNPDTASAFVPTEFTISVKDAQGFDVPDALVSLLKIDPNKSQQFITKKTTDPTGKVVIIAPPSLPYTHFVFDATKGGYASDPVEIIVDQNIVKFNPTQLSFTLPNAPNTEQFLPLDITNLSQETLILKKATLTGDFQGFLSNGEMQNYVKQYVDVTSIGPVQEKTIQVKASTSPVVNVISNKGLKGNLSLTFQSVSSSQEWVQNVPITVGIKVITDCDEGGIQLSGTPGSGELITTSFNSKSQTPFQILNTCMVDGQPFPLKNLKAKVVWKSQPIGNVELSMNDIEASNQAVEVLKNGTFVPFFDEFRTSDDTLYESLLTFTPFPKQLGETAQFTVTIAGEAGTGSKVQTISESFDVKIKVTNLESCVKFDPEPEQTITMDSDEDEVEFKVDTSACGSVPVDLWFCAGQGNENCRGGAPEGRLYLSQFTANDVSGSKTFTIERKGGTLPGAYDITVDARVPGISYYQIASLNVEIQSDSSYAFDVEKPSFVLYAKNAKDSSSVINRKLLEPVKVTASVCDWGEASSKGSNFLPAVGWGVGAGAVTYALAASSAEFVAASTVCGPICVGVAVAIAVIIIVYDLLADDPCDDDTTATLQDYVINLSGESEPGDTPPDAIDVKISSNAAPHISGEWELSASQPISKKGVASQTAAIVVTNKTGYSDPYPLFGVMTLRAKIHDNGDPSHSGAAAVKCSSEGFANFDIGPTGKQGDCKPTSDDPILEEKFHVKFKTQDVDNSLPELTFDSVACSDGSQLGQSGKGALPRVALNWAWNDTTGIPIDACDALNGNHIYCDATQFNIMMMKRVKVLDEFLAANNYQFTCPENPGKQKTSATFPSNTSMGTNLLGITAVGYQFAPSGATTITFTADVNNTTSSAQTADVLVKIGSNNSDDVIPSPCTATSSVPAAGGAKLSCTISGFGLSPSYFAEFTLSSTTTSSIAFSQPIITLNTKSVEQQIAGTCDDLTKTTALMSGIPGINYWIDSADPEYGTYVNDETITFTPSVPNVQALNNLLHFDAYLIRDGYSADFEEDFRDYYVNNSFADAPTWFKGIGNAPVFSKFYGTDKLTFSNKYFNDSTLPAAGKYRVDLSIFFGNDWSFFDGNGSPKAGIAVEFYHLENPFPNSPFYRMPFDGLVGLENTIYDRIGYGVEYINSGPEIVQINDSLIQTYSGVGSSALSKVTVEESSDLRKLNSIPSTRGNLLEVTANAGTSTGTMTFTPSLATPLMMRVNHNVTPNPFASYYQLALNGVPQDTGNTLTFWEGAGNCYDFTGTPIYEKFNYSPDRAGLPTDKYPSWPYLYAVDWEKALVGGNAFLRTIFYTPTDGSYSLNAEASTGKYITANYPTYSNTQLLDGISTMPYNNASSTINSIQDVFDLVGEGKICVSDSGAKARFFWNPETIYKQTGQTSISAVTNQLKAGNTCLGPPGGN